MDPLKIIGSGALMLSVKKGMEAEIRRALRGIARVTPIGEFTRGPRTVVASDGRRKVLHEAPEDELWRVFDRTR